MFSQPIKGIIRGTRVSLCINSLDGDWWRSETAFIFDKIGVIKQSIIVACKRAYGIAHRATMSIVSSFLPRCFRPPPSFVRYIDVSIISSWPIIRLSSTQQRGIIQHVRILFYKDIFLSVRILQSRYILHLSHESYFRKCATKSRRFLTSNIEI